MTLLPRGVKVHLAFRLYRHAQGHRRARDAGPGRVAARSFLRPSLRVQGPKANLIKIVYWDGTGLCLFTKRLEHGVFLWPSNVEPDGTLMLIDGVDWRAPERQWQDNRSDRLTQHTYGR
jgi:transposase